MSDKKFVDELANTNSQTQSSKTVESRIQDKVSSQMPWWGYALAGAGLFLAGKIGGGAIRTIDLLAGETSVAKAGMTAADAIKRFGTVESSDVTSTIFGRLSFTNRLIGQPKVFMSDKIFNKIPNVYNALFNNTTLGSLTGKAIMSIPGVQNTLASSTDWIVQQNQKMHKVTGTMREFSVIAKSIMGSLGMRKQFDDKFYSAVEELGKVASKSASVDYGKDNYLLPQIVGQISKVADMIPNADKDTASSLKASLTEYLSKQKDILESKAKKMSVFGLHPVSYEEHSKRFGLKIAPELEMKYAKARHTIGNDILPKWEEMLKLPASPELFETSKGNLTRAYSASKIIADTTRKFLSRVNIPYLAFNPLTLLQPGFMEEMSRKRFTVELGSNNYVPYKEGITTVENIARDYGIHSKNAKMMIVNGKAYLTSAKKTVAVNEIGNVHVLRSQNVSSAMNRIYAMETGMYKNGIQKADVIFNNKNNVEGSIFYEINKSIRRAMNVRLKRWKKSFAGEDVFELLRTMSEMHNANQHTDDWKLFAQHFGTYDLNRVEAKKLFLDYISQTKAAKTSFRELAQYLKPSQRDAMYKLFGPTTKESKLYSMLMDKGDEILTDRFLNQETEAGLTYKDVLVIGATKRKMAMTEPDEFTSILDSFANFYGPNEAPTKKFKILKSDKALARRLTELHVRTEYFKAQITNRTSLGDWLPEYSKNFGTEKTKEMILGSELDKLLEKHHSDVEGISKTANGFSFFQKMFTNLEARTKNVTKLRANDYLLIGKMRTPWDVKKQGGTTKDWFLQMLPTPSTFAKRSTVPGLLTHWLVERPYDLLEYTGLGRPNYSTTYNAASTVGSLLLRRILPLYGAVAGMGYAGYLIKKYTGVDPKKPAYEYGKRVGIGALRLGEFTGITPSMRWMHSKYPGLLTMASAAYGQYTSNMRTAMLFGSAASFVENVPTARKTALSWYGVNQVPVKNGRWWELGSGPFQGGMTKYYRPSLAYLASTNWQYTSTLWGNETNYRRYGSMLPTPTNLFDVLPVIGRNKFLAEMHSEDRPYGFVGTGVMNTQAEQQLRNSTSASASYGGTLAIASYKQSNANTQNDMQTIQHEASIIRANSLKASIGYISKYIAEYPGMPGFMASAAVQPFIKQRQLYIAKPGYMGSSYKQYYQKELGSVFGMSELFRRMMPNQHPWYNTITGNIRNTQPQWLPQRFQYGDPYAQSEFGEVRLPGEAYLATHPLANNHYSAAEQALISANVSPRSSAYDKAMSMLRSEQPQTAGERYTAFEAAKEHQSILMGNALPVSPYATKMVKKKITLGKYLGQGIFENSENSHSVIKFAGTQSSLDAIATNLFNTQNITMQRAYEEAQVKEKQLNEHLKTLSNTSVEAVVPKDQAMRYQMMMNGGLVEEVYNKGIHKQLLSYGALPTDSTTMSNYANHKALFGARLDRFRHLDNFFMQKFGGTEDALEYYKRHLYSGTIFQNWSKPITSFLMPTLLKPTGGSFFNNMTNSFLTGAFGSVNLSENINPVLGMSVLSGMESFLPSVPSAENKKRIELENKYMLAEYKMGKNDLFGPQLPSLKTIEKQLPQPESEYFPQFLNAPSGKREEISKVVPDAERYLLQEYWHLKDMAANNEVQQASVQPIQEANIQASQQMLNNINEQSENLNLMMSRRTYTDKISLAMNSMGDKSMLQPVYSSAGMDLSHKQKQGFETAHYYGAKQQSMNYNGTNSLNLRRMYGH